MLRIYGEALAALELLRPVLVRIARCDRDLANQLRRSSASVVLNIAEGSGARGGNKKAHFGIAFGSLKETQACLDVAKAFGYVGELGDDLGQKLHDIGGALYRLST